MDSPIVSKYQYSNDKTVGGYSLQHFIENNQTIYGGDNPFYAPQSANRFKDLLIPAGFVLQSSAPCSSISIKQNKVATIPDDLFDSIFQNATRQRKNNKTKKNR
jgi:hypothetical protein